MSLLNISEFSIKTIRVIFIYIIIITNLYSQNSKINGTVKDSKTGKPLVGANVFLKATSLGTATSSDGTYQISNVGPGEYILQSSKVEKSHCHQIILKMALANPLVGFSFKADGRELLNIKPENKVDGLYLNRIRNLMGTSFSDEAIKIENSKQISDKKFAKIYGFIHIKIH